MRDQRDRNMALYVKKTGCDIKFPIQWTYNSIEGPYPVSIHNLTLQLSAHYEIKSLRFLKPKIKSQIAMTFMFTSIYYRIRSSG